MEARLATKLEKDTQQKLDEITFEMKKQKKDFERQSKNNIKRYNNSLKHHQEKFDQ